MAADTAAIERAAERQLLPRKRVTAMNARSAAKPATAIGRGTKKPQATRMAVRQRLTKRFRDRCDKEIRQREIGQEELNLQDLVAFDHFGSIDNKHLRNDRDGSDADVTACSSLVPSTSDNRRGLTGSRLPLRAVFVAVVGNSSGEATFLPF